MVDGLASPTSLIFLDNNNILLLEKGGNVRLVSDGVLQPEPVLQIEDIESNNERGLLGIAYDGVKSTFLSLKMAPRQREFLPKTKSGIEYIAMLGTAPL